jgi:hypothetical protein
MSIQLNLDEMLEIMRRINHPQAANFQWALETIGTAMAERIAPHFHCQHGNATSEGVGFAGTCAPFMPRYHMQPCPEIFTEYDAGGAEDWLEQSRDESLACGKPWLFLPSDGVAK